MKSVYIHIPFCMKICTYCDFCKLFYNTQLVSDYLTELKKEIRDNYNGEVINTLYIGGGTPSSLSMVELEKLFDIIKIFELSDNIEFTFEANPENLTTDKMKFLKKNAVNRLSVGVESFNDEFLKYMGRNHTGEEAFKKIKEAKKYFSNINIDLIYALKDQTMSDLKEDINKFLNLGVNHISTYSLILEPNTVLYLKSEKYIESELDFKMFAMIKNNLEKEGYIHYETSNFSKEGYESKHNLVYWDNNEYYGFGLGASGYINNKRYDNTRSINKYLAGEHIKEISELTKNEKIENEFMLGFRKTKGINKKDFAIKYNKDMLEYSVINKLINEGKLLDDGVYISIHKDYLFTANNILIDLIGENYE